MTSPYRILVGVCGGIAAYKSADVVRRFKDAGCELQVVMTDHARHFIGATALQAVSGNPVRGSLWDEAAEASMGHIELARWPDAIVIAPATANTLAKLAHGLADDLLTTLCLATDKPIFIAPAMNRLMWANAATQANLATLRGRGFQVIEPASGAQACGDIGAGRLPEAAVIREQVLALLQPTPRLDLTVLITAGPTREAIDPVRFISNRSSGKQGYALAESYQRRGARVVLVSGPTALPCPLGVERIEVESAADMLAACQRYARESDVMIGCAAVADYRMQAVSEQKIKKNDDTLRLELVKNPDILATLRPQFPHLFMVGFAAETEKMAEHAVGKLQRKGLQMIAANDVGGGKVFEQADNQLTVFWQTDGQLQQQTLVQASKAAVAEGLVALIEALRSAMQAAR
jgi:phosphopantothenoylcysteine decarboxylase/phosphopantothenate--cysteine ligase